MARRTVMLAAFTAGAIAAGCSTMPAMPSFPLATGALPGAAEQTGKLGKPVVAARPTRMYVWAGFKEKDCSAAPPNVSITQNPAKGQVTLKPNEATFIQHSASGKCIGKSLPGTAIYYTAQKGQDGDDSFTVTATSASGQTMTKSFHVNIIE